MHELPPNIHKFVASIPLFKGAADIHIAPLQDVISLNNANVRVEAGGKAYLVRIGADTCHFMGIQRQEEIAAARAAATVGVAPDILYAEPGGCMVMPFVTGRHWTPEDFHLPSNMARIVDVLRRLHSVRSVQATTSIYARVEYLLATARSLAVELPSGLNRYSERMRHIERERSADGFTTQVLTHGDLWANNFLDDGQQLWLVDWEFAGLSDGLYDLATLSMAGQYSEAEQQTLLNLYGYVAPNALENLCRMQWIARLFEGAWALVQHGLITTRQREPSDFDYLIYANRMFAILDNDL